MIKQSSSRLELGSADLGQGFSDEVLRHYQPLLGTLGWLDRQCSRPIKAVGVTGCSCGEGTSTIAAQLATAAASCSQGHVVLVEANLARPSVSRILGVNSSPGLAESLFGRQHLKEAIQPSRVTNLSIVAAGRISGDPAQAFDRQHAAGLIRQLREQFELVVFDLPPSGESSTALRMAALLDGVLLVVEAGRTAWPLARRTVELLSRAKAHLLGAVLNKRYEEAQTH